MFARIALAFTLPTCAVACLSSALVSSVEARARLDLECGDVKMQTPAGSVGETRRRNWQAFGCGRVAYYLCHEKLGFRPEKLGGPVVVDTKEAVCVRGWIEEVE